jgi:tetratricopeptide (TPR) repeat protein
MKPSAPLLAALSLALALPATSRAKDSVHASRGSITLPTYPWAAVKHPYFRGTDRVNIYPYPMLDFLSRDPTNRTYQTVVLENDFLRITFLPELGGKIHEVIDKTIGQPMFYVNHVIKPALIGQAGAWTSGGVEWNTGPQGHTVGCMQPVPVVILPRAKDGSQSVAIGETERIYGTKWTVVVTLRPGRSFIEERIRIYNPTETIRPYYFWNCTAVPNTKGFRFIYPMTLGTDHGAEKFFNWPIHEGKDLSRGTNYQDASSIFAWHCDQDFFGSYNDDLDRGVVAYANHHQLPGKKAWTWGWGSYGTMHQMDLTDDDGPYNEVQTGPLLTQGEVGRLDPCEAVEWQEWWYPIHGLGGFTFANKDVAVNIELDDRQLRLRVMATKDFDEARLSVRLLRAKKWPASWKPVLSPRRATTLTLDLDTNAPPFLIEIGGDRRELAAFRFPLEFPVRKPPQKSPVPQTAAGLTGDGWSEFLFARFPEAESKFRQALERDPNSVSAETGMAFLNLDRDPPRTTNHASTALKVDPGNGLARLVLAIAEARLGNDAAALENAWKACLDPKTAVAGRALAAKQLFRLGRFDDVIAALSETGPWESDPVCRNRLALALLRAGDQKQAVKLARANLEVDPLDGFATSLITLRDARVVTSFGIRTTSSRSTKGIAMPPEKLLDLVGAYEGLYESRLAMWILEHRYSLLLPKEKWDGLVRYWAYQVVMNATSFDGVESVIPVGDYSPTMNRMESVLPSRYEDLAVFQVFDWTGTSEGVGPLYFGHLLFHLGRHAEGRAMWQKAAELGAEPVIAYRALGMAAKTLDNDLKSAREWLTKASQADPQDAIVARDLANVLFALSDKADSDAGKRELTTEARDRLKGAFEQGKGRSDFVALLARSHSRLGETTETAKLLDSVRITIWEGAHEAHDLFEEAHLALGEAHLKAGRPAEALAEFNRALEYPKNLATGRRDNTCDAHLHFRRGQALAALGRKDEAAAAWQQAVAEPESKDEKKEKAREQAREALRETVK